MEVCHLPSPIRSSLRVLYPQNEDLVHRLKPGNVSAMADGSRSVPTQLAISVLEWGFCIEAVVG